MNRGLYRDSTRCLEVSGSFCCINRQSQRLDGVLLQVNICRPCIDEGLDIDHFSRLLWMGKVCHHMRSTDQSHRRCRLHVTRLHEAAISTVHQKIEISQRLATKDSIIALRREAEELVHVILAAFVAIILVLFYGTNLCSHLVALDLHNQGMDRTLHGPPCRSLKDRLASVAPAQCQLVNELLSQIAISCSRVHQSNCRHAASWIIWIHELHLHIRQAVQAFVHQQITLRRCHFRCDRSTRFNSISAMP
mmetsp:Transcript_18061/g.42201  ORF Transcript_18061/g.42201 Transcript_18061/m.42201 type:complete len:249 (-) Transcript_18061:248-994(-)